LSRAIDKAVLADAEKRMTEAVAIDPSLNGHTRKVLTAAAYLLQASSIGQRISIYEAADMFDISDLPLRRCYREMAAALGFQRKFERAERTRNSYDIYAEIIRNEAVTMRDLLKKVHISTSELKKHLAFLKEHGLLSERVEGKSRLYFPTDKGHDYVEAYSKMRTTMGNGAG
jgi:predicted transcriptional regulator